jgi:hypothetical protein
MCTQRVGPSKPCLSSSALKTNRKKKKVFSIEPLERLAFGEIPLTVAADPRWWCDETNLSHPGGYGIETAPLTFADWRVR